jgi:type IV pilus assembly protein PilB
MVLVTGPTGSGKTTTLYSALTELNTIHENICTAEDPVEYTLKGVNQVQMHDAIGLNFAAALRSFLRQDPDIIMVGEIRDYETAEIAVKAALTGHLVLSTLHTNDAPSSVNRLLNMGIEPFLVTASVLLIQAQRLVRKVCTGCKEKIDVSPQVLKDIQATDEMAQSMECFKGVGCMKCSKTGYKGRLALSEVMPLWEEIKEFVLNGASTSEIKREAIRLGMKTMRQAGITKINEGITTIDEVVRVTATD